MVEWAASIFADHARPLLERMTRDPDWNVRAKAAETFGVFYRYGPTVTLDALKEFRKRDFETLTVLFDDSNLDVRKAAIKSIGSYKNEGAMDTLMEKALSDPNAAVRETAGFSVRSQSLRPRLEKLLVEEPDREVRIGVLYGIEHFRDERACATIRAQLKIERDTKFQNSLAGTLKRSFANYAGIPEAIKGFPKSPPKPTAPTDDKF